MGELESYAARVRRLVDDRLLSLAAGDDPRCAKPHAAVRHTVEAGGKRLRPVLFFASCEVCGARPEPFLDAACAVELVHTASLVLDDLPCMDDAQLRRGRPTLHVLYDEATAVLAAVAELMAAFELIARCPGIRRDSLARDMAAELARAVGLDGMIAGQQLDLDSVGRRLSTDEMEFVHARKTGALFTATARMGALAAGASEPEIQALDAYAKNLGLAFQIVDDILDATATAEELGKDVGKDAEKPTFVHLFGLETSRTVAGELIATAKGSLGVFRRGTAVLGELADFVLARKS
ncbi:MAG TPA: farnesyl diphosphate synthase [bacterium]|nr:farnesyl diphosphate synthase [bacterium]